GSAPDGSEFLGVVGLEAKVLAKPDLFVRTLAEKLMTYGLGRGVEPFDAPATRRIVRSAEKDSYRFSSLVESIVTSVPFTQRMSASQN
ncbi:MAG: DUF1585 domain-containing protein, partial [Verrucomicrobiota bacterium]